MIYGQKRYAWREGRKYPVSAQIAGEFVEELAERDGEVKPEQLLDASRDEDAPLHKCFEWNDGKAAEHWRKNQARILLNSLVCVRIRNDGSQAEAKPHRAFVNVSEGNEASTFKLFTVAMSSERERAIVMANAHRELSSVQKKLKEYEEFEDVCDVIEVAQEKLREKDDKEEDELYQQIVRHCERHYNKKLPIRMMV